MTKIRRIIVGAVLAFAFTIQAEAQKPSLNLTLPQAIQLALEQNPTIRVADTDIRLKEIADQDAWQALLPTIDATLGLTHNIQVAKMKFNANGETATMKMGNDGTTTAIGGITLAVPLFSPSVYQNMKLTKDDIKLAEEKARSSRLDLVNQVTKAYYSALLSIDSRDVIKKNYEVSKENYEVVSKKYNVGSVSEYDKISAEVQMRSMNSNVVNAETGVTLALLQLKVLMGVTADVDITLNDNLRNYEGSLTLADVDAAGTEVENNTSIRQLDLNRAVLERTQKILRTNFMPTASLSLTGQYSSYSNDNWNVFKYEYNPSSTLAININIPIFHVSNWSKIKSNKLQLMELADTREHTVRQINMAVQSYRSNMLKTISKIESDKEAVRQADKAVMISEKRYNVGKGTILELNQSETALTQAELTYNQSIYDYLSNKADLEYTLGKTVE